MGWGNPFKSAWNAATDVAKQTTAQISNVVNQATSVVKQWVTSINQSIQPVAQPIKQAAVQTVNQVVPARVAQAKTVLAATAMKVNQVFNSVKTNFQAVSPYKPILACPVPAEITPPTPPDKDDYSMGLKYKFDEKGVGVDRSKLEIKPKVVLFNKQWAESAGYKGTNFVSADGKSSLGYKYLKTEARSEISWDLREKEANLTVIKAEIKGSLIHAETRGDFARGLGNYKGELDYGTAEAKADVGAVASKDELGVKATAGAMVAAVKATADGGFSIPLPFSKHAIVLGGSAEGSLGSLGAQGEAKAGWTKKEGFQMKAKAKLGIGAGIGLGFSIGFR